MTEKELAKYIDHTFLKPTGGIEEIEQLCSEAKKHQFYAVCVPPIWLEKSKSLLSGSSVKIATVIGFPHGNQLSISKAKEAADCMERGADEIDMVAQIGLLKDGELKKVYQDIQEVKKITQDRAVLKVIVESSLLSNAELKNVIELVVDSGAEFIKTSTGFNGEGARLEDVQLMKSLAGNRLKIKASGGIRDNDNAMSFINAGADRLGCSSSVQIINGLR